MAFHLGSYPNHGHHLPSLLFSDNFALRLMGSHQGYPSYHAASLLAVALLFVPMAAHLYYGARKTKVFYQKYRYPSAHAEFTWYSSKRMRHPEPPYLDRSSSCLSPYYCRSQPPPKSGEVEPIGSISLSPCHRQY